jgi:hypothetical protein
LNFEFRDAFHRHLLRINQYIRPACPSGGGFAAGDEAAEA